jgi:hypothetical protein
MDDGLGIDQTGQIRQRTIHAQMRFAPGKQRTDEPPALQEIAETGKLDDKMPGHGELSLQTPCCSNRTIG